MSKEILNPSEWKKPRGYSHLVKTTGGATLHLAGQAAFDAEGNLVGEGDFPVQYEQTLKNIEVVLKTGGAGLADIVRLKNKGKRPGRGACEDQGSRDNTGKVDPLVA